MVPLVKKLAYAWERATGTDTIYSDVFSRQEENAAVHDDNFGATYGPVAAVHNRWIKATPVKGQVNRYEIAILNCRHHSTQAPKHTLVSMMDYDMPGTQFSRGQVTGIIAETTRQWRAEGYVPANRQPFGGNSAESPTP